MNRFRKILIQLLHWGIGLAALVWALSGVELAMLWQAVRSYSAAAMLPVFFFAALDYFCLGARLTCLMPPDVGLRRGIAVTLLCTGMNCILPAKAGDALKIVYLVRTTPHSLVEMTSVVIWDRLMDVICLVLLLCFSWTQVGSSDLGMSLAVPAGALAACCLGFFIMRHWSAFFHGLYARFLPGKLASPLDRLHTSLVDSVSLSWVAKGMLWSVAVWLTYFLSFYFAAGFMAGFAITAPQMLVCLTVATVGTAIPSLPGGIGLFEGAMVLSLGWFGVDGTSALGLALFFHAVHFVPLVVCAVIINGRASYWKDKDEASPDKAHGRAA